MSLARFAAFCFTVLAVFPLFAAPSQPVKEYSTETVEGITQSELTKRWWQWAGSFAYPDSPVSDTTGERCGAGQEGPVWFLAGAYGSAPAKRTCRVPAGKHLFFPLINYVVMPRNCNCSSCEEATAMARAMTGRAMGLFVETDGRALEGLDRHRVASPPGCFNMAERAPNMPKIGPSASDGYWMHLPPLQRERTRCDSGDRFHRCARS